MAMLSDRDLINIIKEKDVVSPFIAENCQGATINLTLDSSIKIYKSKEIIVLGKEVTDDHYQTIDLSKEDYLIPPHESVLISTFETVNIPDDMSGIIYERYSVKSLNLTISPSHYMNPGYRGKVTLNLTNNSPVPVKIVQGIKICQFSLHELTSTPLAPYEKQDAKYMDASGVSISKLHLDKEIQEFLISKGVKRVSDELARDLGDHLLKHIKEAAKDLAEIAREKFNGESNE